MAIRKVISRSIEDGAVNTADITASNLNIDSGTLFVDATNNRVGVNNASPAASLDVWSPVSSGNAAIFRGQDRQAGDVYITRTALSVDEVQKAPNITLQNYSGSSSTYAAVMQLGLNGGLDTYVYNGAWLLRSRLDANGRLILAKSTTGSTASQTVSGFQAGLQLQGVDTDSTIAMSLVRHASGDPYSSPLILFGRTRGTTLNSVNAVSSGDQLGAIGFAGADGTNLSSTAAEIRAYADYSIGTGSVPGRISFHTTTVGATSAAERVRIDRNGVLSVGDSGNGLAAAYSGDTKLEVRSSHSTNTKMAAVFINDYNNYDANGTLPYPVIRLSRSGKTGSTYSSNVDFSISRYENVGTAAKTRLSVQLTNGSTNTPDITVMTLSSGGMVSMPSQPFGNYWFTTTTAGYRTVSTYTNIGNCLTNVYAGGGSTYGLVDRFTAPEDGRYLITININGIAQTSNLTLISIYGSWNGSVNSQGTGAEIIDLRSAGPLPNDLSAWCHIFNFAAGDYIEIDNYRPAPTAYCTGGQTVHVSIAKIA